MQTLKILGFLATIGLIASGTACKKKSPSPQEECIEGVVIAEARKMNENPNLSMVCAPVVQIKNRNIGSTWNGFDNCVTVFGLNENLNKIGQNIYFKDYEELLWLFPADCNPPASKYIHPKSVSNKCENLSTK